MPKISVVTVTYNAEKFIEESIKSLLAQTYKNIEYIIVDGESSDDTLKIIDKYRDKIDILISEKDTGIYDAMNKGINLSSGDWLFFLNSGDVFYSADTVSKLVQALDSTIDILYGDIITVDEKMENQDYLVANGIENIEILPPFWHQGMLIKTSLHKKRLYDLKYKSCSDYDFMMYCVTNNFNCKYINLPFTYYLRGGESTTNIYMNRLEGVAISSKYLDINLLDKNFFFRDLIDNHIKETEPLSKLLLELDTSFRSLEIFLTTIKERYKKIALYGGGTIANLIAPFIGNNLKIIADKNHTQIDSIYPTCLPEDLKLYQFDCILITPIRNSTEIKDYLTNTLKIDLDKVITFDNIVLGLRSNNKTNL
ncbi:MAG: glycosyltransferase family 2 protein [Arcobacter sp.]